MAILGFVLVKLTARIIRLSECDLFTGWWIHSPELTISSFVQIFSANSHRRRHFFLGKWTRFLRNVINHKINSVFCLRSKLLQPAAPNPAIRSPTLQAISFSEQRLRFVVSIFLHLSVLARIWLSVRPSVCRSACLSSLTPFFATKETISHHFEITLALCCLVYSYYIPSN